jgi:transcriptional regulator with XRE-family HTH domain
VIAGSEAFYAALGQRVRAVREQQSLTQTQLGTRLVPPVTRASIANVEAGKQRILAHTLVQIARVLRTPLDQLVPAYAESGAELSASIEQELRAKLPISPVVLSRLTRVVRRVTGKERVIGNGRVASEKK